MRLAFHPRRAWHIGRCKLACACSSAIMRAREALRDREADPTVPGTSGAMIVVEFPAGQTPPAKDATIARDAQNGFVIRSVRRGQGGQIMILADDVGAR